MKLSTAVAARDAWVIGQLKNYIAQRLTEGKKEQFIESADQELREIFRKADDHWSETLEDLCGKDKASSIIEHLKADYP